MLRGVVNCFLKVMRDTCKWNFFPALMQSDVGRKLVAILTEELAGIWHGSWQGSWLGIGMGVGVEVGGEVGGKLAMRGNC